MSGDTQDTSFDVSWCLGVCGFNCMVGCKYFISKKIITVQVAVLETGGNVCDEAVHNGCAGVIGCVF